MIMNGITSYLRLNYDMMNNVQNDAHRQCLTEHKQMKKKANIAKMCMYYPNPNPIFTVEETVRNRFGKKQIWS